ncbi:prophage protein gp49 [Escherichia coli]|nr:prophage protein gp49 [Escherichia coli]
MFNVITHPAALNELIELPDNLRGRMARLIERLEQEGNKMKMPHSRVIGGGLFELRVGDKNIARTLYAYATGNEIYLLHAFVKKTQKTPTKAIEIARMRLKEMKMKVKGVPFSQVKQKLLNTPEAVKGYEDADKELEMVEMLYEMREKAGLTKSALAERMGLRPSAISRLESNPLGASMKTLTKYAQACGATINIHAVY